jgi:hypothetical protein
MVNGMMTRGQPATRWSIVLSVLTSPGGAWLLIDGMITLVLAVMILGTWPSGAAWVVGTLVGISMFFSGTSQLVPALVGPGAPREQARQEGIVVLDKSLVTTTILLGLRSHGPLCPQRDVGARGIYSCRHA